MKWIVGLHLILVARGHLCCKSCFCVCMNRCKAVLCHSVINEISPELEEQRMARSLCRMFVRMFFSFHLVLAGSPAQREHEILLVKGRRQTPLFWKRFLRAAGGTGTGTESKIVEFGKDIWRSSNPTPLLSYKFLQILIFTQILKISEDGDSIMPLGNLFCCSVTLSVT